MTLSHSDMMAQRVREESKCNGSNLAEGTKISYELVTGRHGKVSAENLRLG
jgi:hypothetical protein